MSAEMTWTVIGLAIVAYIWFLVWAVKHYNKWRAWKEERDFQKQRKAQIEWEVRQRILDQKYAKKAADKILREQGQTP